MTGLSERNTVTCVWRAVSQRRLVFSRFFFFPHIYIYFFLTLIISELWSGAGGVIAEMLCPESACRAPGARGSHFSSPVTDIKFLFAFHSPVQRFVLLITKSQYDGSLSCQAQHSPHPFDGRFLGTPFSDTLFLGGFPKPMFLCIPPSLSPASVAPGLSELSLVKLRVDLGVSSGNLSSTDNCYLPIWRN